MSRFGIVESAFWQNRKVAPLTDSQALLLLYLFSCPHGNSIGCYALPEGYISADRPQWDAETVRETLSILSRKGFIERDDATKVTRVVGWFGHNPPANGKVVMSMLKAVDALPACRPKLGMLRSMAEIDRDFMQPFRNGIANRIETLSKRFPDTQEPRPDQNRPDQDQEQNLDQNQDSAADAARGAIADMEISRPAPRRPGITAPTKYARRLDGGFETETGEFVSFEEAFWAEKDLAANRDIGGSMMGALLAAHGGDAGAAYDALLLALKKSDPRRYVGGIIRKRETEAQHAKAAANGSAKALPGDPKKVPAWVLELRGMGETVAYNAKRKYWEHGGRGFDDDQQEVAF